MISESYDPEEYGGPGESGPGSLSHDRIVEAAIDFVDHNGSFHPQARTLDDDTLTRYRRTLGDDHPAPSNRPTTSRATCARWASTSRPASCVSRSLHGDTGVNRLDRRAARGGRSTLRKTIRPPAD